MTHFICSTHTNHTNYVEYEKASGKNHNVIKRRFTVMGGHGLCNKNLITPQGVITPVHKQEDMDWLNSLDSFQSDIKKKFISVMKHNREPEKVAKDMIQKDGSAPKTSKDYVVKDIKSRSYTSNITSSSL